MASRRMFSKDITQSDAFRQMGLGAQALYFHLGMEADDDGVVNNFKSIQRSIGANDDDLKILLAKRFILSLGDGDIIVIKHWKINNYIQKDRYTPTKYQKELKELGLDENGAYTENQLSLFNDFPCIQNGYTGKDSIGKVSKVKDSEEKNNNLKENEMKKEEFKEDLNLPFNDFEQVDIKPFELSAYTYYYLLEFIKNLINDKPTFETFYLDTYFIGICKEILTIGCKHFLTTKVLETKKEEFLEAIKNCCSNKISDIRFEHKGENNDR